MRPQDPVHGVPDSDRYRGNGAGSTADRYAPIRGRGDAGVYISLACTLEEEADRGGWLPNATPTGPKPRRLFTIGMRGEPGFDDDPVPDSTNTYVQGGGGPGDANGE